MDGATGDRDQDHPQEKQMQKSKGKKERYIHLNAEFQRIARRDSEQGKLVEVMEFQLSYFKS